MKYQCRVCSKIKNKEDFTLGTYKMCDMCKMYDLVIKIKHTIEEIEKMYNISVPSDTRFK